MDSLAALFAHVSPTAQTFFAGNLCASVTFSETAHVHLLRRGQITLEQPGKASMTVASPTLLFFPEDRPHTIVVDPDDGADLVCARVDLGRGSGNPIGADLPAFVALDLTANPELAAICELLVAEAFGTADGRQAALDRLFEYLLILLVRDLIARGVVANGVLAGLADPRLARALTAIHEAPDKAWTLEDLAVAAGMSRTRFASLFRRVVGTTPIDYLAGWRMAAAQRLLRQGRPLKSVIRAVGYGNAAAFARRFAQATGHSPRQWLALQRTVQEPPAQSERLNRHR